MDGKGAEGSKSLKRAVSLTNYFFSLPSIPALIATSLAIALLFGLAVNLPPGEDFVLKAVEDGFFLLLAPAIATVAAVKALIRRMPLKNIIATAAAGEFIYAIVYVISLFVLERNLFYGQMIIFIGSAFVFLLWYLIGRLIFILKYRSLLFAVLQLFLYMFFLFEFKASAYFSAEPMLNLMIKGYLASFILLASVYVLFAVINAPMKKTFGYGSTDVFALFVSQWIYKKNDLETAFEKIGETAKTLVGVVCFKRRKDVVFFIVPYIHFGPFGNLGGSEFSSLIADEVRKMYGAESLVFHGTSTHDLNPTSRSELEKITGAIKGIVKRAEYGCGTVGLRFGQAGECKADVLFFGDDAFIGVTRAPYLTEDINFGLGLSMILAAEKKVENAIVADQHNAELGEVTSFEPGSEIGYRYIKAVEEAVSEKPKQQKLKIGISARRTTANAVGKAGIKVAALSSEPPYMLIVIDSNGITPEFREKIEKTIMGRYGHKAGVFTTDTHETNTVRGVLNPARDESILLDDIIAAAGEAIKDLQEAKVFVGKEWFEINTIGAKHSIEIVSTINSIVAVARIMTPLALIGAVVAILAVFSRI